MKSTRHATRALADGALDTLGRVMRVMGDDAFPLDDEADTKLFGARCAEFARHIENGAAVPAFDVPQTSDGARDWAQVRRFFADRRRAEKGFVTERLGNYRELVEDLVGGLRKIGERDQSTETRVKQSLGDIESAVGSGRLADIEAALARTVETIRETFDEQKRAYESQLGELNNRLSSLRQDLTAAREKLKRDPLTDAYNRGAFDTTIEQSLNLQFVLDQPVVLVMIDLDNFKDVNDTCGHGAGDKVLRTVSESLERSFIRKGDFVARYGGDEFAILLNDTTLKDARRLIDNSLERISKIDIGGVTGRVSIACSAGYTDLHIDDTADSVIARADRALYAAKKAGRNRAWLIAHDDEAESLA